MLFMNCKETNKQKNGFKTYAINVCQVIFTFNLSINLIHYIRRKFSYFFF